MLLLAADTSGKNGSIALAQCSPDGNCEALEVVPLSGGMFSAQLIPQIAELLKRHNFSKHDLDGFAVASGPGSFTGLRVGLAAIKALAEVLSKPITSAARTIAIRGAACGDIQRHRRNHSGCKTGRSCACERARSQADRISAHRHDRPSGVEEDLARRDRLP